MSYEGVAHPAQNELTGQRLILGAAALHRQSASFVDLDRADAQPESFARHLDRSLAIVAMHRARLRMTLQDRYSVLARNSAAVVNLWHAALLGGGTFTPLNTRLAPAEWEYILYSSGTTAIYLDGPHARAIADAKVSGRLPELRSLLAIDKEAANILGVPPFEQVLAPADRESLPAVNECDPCALMYTGGTTGLPKGVVLNQRAVTLNFYRNAMAGIFVEPQTLINCMPMFHIGSTLASLWCVGGGTLYIMGGFDPKTFLDAVEAHRISAAALAPSMIGMILAHPEYAPERLRSLGFVAYGSSPMPTATLERLLADLPWIRLHQYYGMTEAAPILTLLAPGDHLRPELRASAGRAVPGVELSIRNAEGKLAAPREVGEICARSGSIMVGYLNDPAATRTAIRDGWYHSGDAGYLDEQGYLFIVDRMKDMIVSGGENVYSAEVENAIASHPAVAQVAVIGVPHAKWGEAVHAVIVCKPGAERPAAQEIIDHCKLTIASYKSPKSVEFIDGPLPMSGIMKVQKAKLREPYWAGHDRKIG
jgi:acyl-CoA synthetase (AMP-forming)/AMP-acid ligase II